MIVFKDTAENATRAIGYISQMNMRFSVELSGVLRSICLDAYGILLPLYIYSLLYRVMLVKSEI